jgi:hypothetical protein
MFVDIIWWSLAAKAASLFRSKLVFFSFHSPFEMLQNDIKTSRKKHGQAQKILGLLCSTRDSMAIYGFLSTIQHIFHQKSYNFNLNQYYIRNQLVKLSVFIRLLIVFSDFHIFRKIHPYSLQVRPKKWMSLNLGFYRLIIC